MNPKNDPTIKPEKKNYHEKGHMFSFYFADKYKYLLTKLKEEAEEKLYSTNKFIIKLLKDRYDI